MNYGFSEVYHASPMQGLTQIVPHVGSHGQCWVYATDDITVAVIFLGRLGGDFTCASGLFEGKPYLCERFAGAFDRRYSSAAGSLYTLSGSGFMSGQTSYSKDLVCSQSVTPLEETRVDNAKEYLLGLEADGKLIIKGYPERFCIPDNDSDLVRKAVLMYRRFGQKVLEQVREFHPNLLERVEVELTKNDL